MSVPQSTKTFRRRSCGEFRNYVTFGNALNEKQRRESAVAWLGTPNDLNGKQWRGSVLAWLGERALQHTLTRTTIRRANCNQVQGLESRLRPQ